MPFYDAFISHSSKDNDIARFIRGYFRSHNLDCWLDTAEVRPSESTADSHISDRVTEAIQESRYMLVIVSRDAIASEWVRREVGYARDLRSDGEYPMTEVVGIIIDDLPSEALPDWLNGVRQVRVGLPGGDGDALRALREDIGDPKPTYIDDVRANFIKQIPASKLSDHLELCDGDAVRMWYLNGHSMRTFIAPALTRMIERRGGAPMDLEVVLLDTVYLGGQGAGGMFSSAKKLQSHFDERLKASSLFSYEGAHHDAITRTVDYVGELGTRFDGLTTRVLLSPLLPAGRIVFVGDYGFFGPYTQPLDVTAPYFVFNSQSPFSGNLEGHYARARAAARPYKP